MLEAGLAADVGVGEQRSADVLCRHVGPVSADARRDAQVAEVGPLDGAVLSELDEDVVRLDVTVDGAAAAGTVEVSERLGGVEDDAVHVCCGECAQQC